MTAALAWLAEVVEHLVTASVFKITGRALEQAPVWPQDAAIAPEIAHPLKPHLALVEVAP